MYYIFEINFNRAQQQIKMNTASVRNIFFLMKSTEILTTMMYSSTYKLKGNISPKVSYTGYTYRLYILQRYK